ncbi:MAG: ATPase, partial [Thermodesulfobacteriota bacterium]
LLGTDLGPGRTRVSVISLVGLPATDSQQQFLAQLALALFTWIKKNPAPSGLPLRGLLVLDEARDFVPAAAPAACKAALIRLVSQARKYGLGLIFATQAPKSLENKVIVNCTTQVYGRANSPEAIRVVREQIKQRGGSGEDVPTLEKGRFYLYSETVNHERPAQPVKIAVPMCLTHHPPSPLDEAGVLRRAQASRAGMKGRGC